MNAARLADIRCNVTERIWRQEYEADILSDAGAVFRNLETACVLKPAAPYTGAFAMGIDWGRSNDYTAIVLLDMKTRRQVLLDRFNEIGWTLQRGRLKALADAWRPQVIIAESNSIGAPNIEALQREGLPVQPFETTAASKPALIEGLALALEQGTLALLDDPVQKAELSAYELTRLPSGRYAYGAPAGLHDDTVIALALALHGLDFPIARVRRGLY
jgi:hypothetical protein